jgi:hypothetical protein
MVELLTGRLAEDDEKPSEKPPEDLTLAAASCVSLCHRRTTSFAIGRRWYEETRAAEETEGFLSTIAVFITRSIDCTVVACKSQWPRRGIPRDRGSWDDSYINNATEGADRVRAEDHVGAAAGILHDGARDHDDVLGGAGQLLDHQVNHLAETGILILEEL